VEDEGGREGETEGWMEQGSPPGADLEFLMTLFAAEGKSE
jgi:hypothetical protein